jgi:hypothetical protein
METKYIHKYANKVFHAISGESGIRKITYLFTRNGRAPVQSTEKKNVKGTRSWHALKGRGHLGNLDVIERTYQGG